MIILENNNTNPNSLLVESFKCLSTSVNEVSRFVRVLKIVYFLCFGWWS